MNPFQRSEPPAPWSHWETEWRKKGRDLSSKRAFADWQSKLESLSSWFHRTVRTDGSTRLCAYCDGELGPTSPETIDHFLPEHKCRALGIYEVALSWWNLFPSCVTCNSTAKGAKWSFLLLRPDTDPVSEYFDFDPEDGKLYPAPGLGRLQRARVKKTIRIFGLNLGHRALARKTFLKHMRNARTAGDKDTLIAALADGPYRFAVKQFIEAYGLSVASTTADLLAQE